MVSWSVLAVARLGDGASASGILPALDLLVAGDAVGAGELLVERALEAGERAGSSSWPMKPMMLAATSSSG
jgi:hypothetical protein